MREIIALAIFLGLTLFILYLVIGKRSDVKTITALLFFTLFAGYGVANVDVIRKVKWGSLEVETAKREIKEAKDSAIEELNSAIKRHETTINDLLKQGNKLTTNLETQNVSVGKLLKSADLLQHNFEQQKKDIAALNDRAENTRKEIEKLNAASKKIALSQIKSIYLSLNTRNQFGTPAAIAAQNELIKDINTLLPAILPDPQDRYLWIQELKSSAGQK